MINDLRKEKGVPGKKIREDFLSWAAFSWASQSQIFLYRWRQLTVVKTPISSAPVPKIEV